MSLLRIQNLSKSFGGVQALHDIELEIQPGEVHALCGENGAGKSTLIKILGGVVKPDSGSVFFDGVPMEFGNVRGAEALGIAVMHQESVAFPHLNAVDNLFVGRELRRFGGLLDRAAMRAKTKAMLSRLGESLNLDQAVETFPLAQRQMIGIARALLQDCRLLVMDEPTASLSGRETSVLFECLRQLRREGVSVLYVSHRLREVFDLADRITVLRDGAWVSTDACRELSEPDLIQRMVGRAISEKAGKTTSVQNSGVPSLVLRGLTSQPEFQDVSLDVFPGEILGLGGLVGAGRSEVARCVFGVDSYDSGSIEIEGTPLAVGSVEESCQAGVALVPEDRQHEGLIQSMSIRENLGLPWLRKLSSFGFVNRGRMRDLASESVARLDVKYRGLGDAVSFLSGGNQQKVVLGKWLAGNPKVLILDEPTRGVDVGAKEEVYGLVRRLAAEGVAVLLISSDLPELIRLSDRINVMCEGRIAGELLSGEISEESILRLALPKEGAFGGGIKR